MPDGFKRLHAARLLKGFTHLRARLLEVDEQRAKVAMVAAISAALTSRELSDVVDLLTASSTSEQAHLVLSNRVKLYVNRKRTAFISGIHV